MHTGLEEHRKCEVEVGSAQECYVVACLFQILCALDCMAVL